MLILMISGELEGIKMEYARGLGKPRTKLGQYLDSVGITQEWLVEKTGLTRSTITFLCRNAETKPHKGSRDVIIKVLQNEISPHVRHCDFWDVEEFSEYEIEEEPLTLFGEWFDSEQEEFTIGEFAEVTGVSRVTISTACRNLEWMPSQSVMKKIMDVVKRIDPSKRASHFWDY